MQLAFLLPSIVVAVDMFAAHLDGGGNVNPFPRVVPGHPVENLILGGISYLSVGAVVPLALLLAARTGQGPAALGLSKRGWFRDLLPGFGLASGSYLCTLLVAALIGAALSNTGLVNPTQHLAVPPYYIVYGVLVSIVTAVSEEVIVNGYLLTRLGQLGWRPGPALLLSLCLRTSYHVYYGLGFIFTIPFGYFVTRSFQRHGRLRRPIIAHFLYDASIFTISVLVAVPH